MIGDLLKLETLSFVHSDVKELPIEIGNLTRLKVLDLTGCGELFNIAPGLLRRLVRLEELYMRGTLVSWPDEQITACIRELNSLSLLTALEIELSGYDLLPHDLVFTRLERFRICIGFSIESKMFQNTLKVRFPDRWTAGVLQVLFNRTKILHLHGWRLSPNSILNKPERANFLMLRSLKLERCDLRYLTEIFHGDQYHETAVGEITMNEQLPLFTNLHDLEIVRCFNLTSVFSLAAPADFLKLEDLKIIGCEMMEDIFFNNNNESVVEIGLPNLKCLILDDLPRLTGFCGNASSLALPQLLELWLRNLPKLRTLPSLLNQKVHVASYLCLCLFYANAKRLMLDNRTLQIVSAAQLKVLSISKMKMNNILLPVSCFVNLSVMSFCYCEDLSSVALSDLLRKPKNLKLLHVEDCHLVEVVFDAQRLLTEGHEVLNNLSDLELENLPRLTLIWKHGLETFLGFQNLTRLSVAGCHRLPSVFLPSTATILTHLQEISISECRRMTSIVEEGNELVFPRLKSVELIDLPSLECFCSELHEYIWPKLESVWIDCCREMMIFTGGTSSTPKLREISVNGKNHTVEGDINTDLHWLQQQLNDGDTSDSTLRSSIVE